MRTYSQCGEDRIIEFIFDQYLKIKSPTYMDIGAYHPFTFSNTALLYEKGARGVCIEPDPCLFEEIKKHRKQDVCLNIGVGTGTNEFAEFYVMSSRTLNTFSKEEAERYQSFGNQTIQEVIKVPVFPVNQVIKEHLGKSPNFISLDVEGLDLDILKSFDFNAYRPEVFCIETLTYTEDSSERKISEIIEFMVSKNYFLYADTYINSIFVDLYSWNNRNTQ